jgi:hypothetical protein
MKQGPKEKSTCQKYHLGIYLLRIHNYFLKLDLKRVDPKCKGMDIR